MSEVLKRQLFLLSRRLKEENKVRLKLEEENRKLRIENENLKQLINEETDENWRKRHNSDPCFFYESQEDDGYPD